MKTAIKEYRTKIYAPGPLSHMLQSQATRRPLQTSQSRPAAASVAPPEAVKYLISVISHWLGLEPRQEHSCRSNDLGHSWLAKVATYDAIRSSTSVIERDPRVDHRMWAASCPTLAAGQPRQHNSTQPGTLMCPLALVSSRAGQRSSQAQQKHALLSVTPGLQVHVHWHSVCTAPACAAGCGCRLALDIYTAQRPHRHVCLKGGCASTLHHTWRPQLTVCALIVTRAQASGTLRAAAPAAQQPLEALRQGARRCCFCVLVGHHRVVVAGRLALPTLGGALREWGVRGKPDRQFCVLCVRERCTLASRHKQQQARPQRTGSSCSACGCPPLLGCKAVVSHFMNIWMGWALMNGTMSATKGPACTLYVDRSKKCCHQPKE